MIKVDKQDVIRGLAAVAKERIFPGYTVITPATNDQPLSDNLDAFVTVTPADTAADKVTVGLNVDFVVLATRASTLTELTRAAGRVLPAATMAAAAPTPSTVINGLQVVSEQLEGVLKTDQGIDSLEMEFVAKPVPPPKQLETYSVDVVVAAQLLITDRKKQPLGGEDKEEFARVDASLLAGGVPDMDFEIHTKGEFPVERKNITPSVSGLLGRDPFRVTLDVLSQTSTDGGGDVPATSLVRITDITFTLRANPVPTPRQAEAPSGQGPDALPLQEDSSKGGAGAAPNGAVIGPFFDGLGRLFSTIELGMHERLRSRAFTAAADTLVRTNGGIATGRGGGLRGGTGVGIGDVADGARR